MYVDVPIFFRAKNFFQTSEKEAQILRLNPSESRAKNFFVESQDADFKPSSRIKDMSSFFEYGGSEKCELELRLAHAILAQEVNSVEEVCAKFDLTTEEAVTILNNEEFLKLLDKLERINNILLIPKVMRALRDALKNGRGGEKLAAFDIMQELIERGWPKPKK